MPHPAFEVAGVAWLAAFGGHWVLFDRLAVVLADNELLKTLPYMLVLVGFWHCRAPGLRRRARREIIAGVAAAGLAIVVSRLLQNLISSVRPIWDPVYGALFPLDFQRVIDPDYHSFPSDHVALLFPLAVTVYRLDARLGAIGGIWFVLIALVRVYLGLHYPLDLLGGALIGTLALVITHAVLNRTDGRVLGSLEWMQRQWPAMTAAGLFLVAYQYATLFAASRDLGSRVFNLFARLAW